MELFLSGPLLQFCNASFPTGASVRDLVDIFTKEKMKRRESVKAQVEQHTLGPRHASI